MVFDAILNFSSWGPLTCIGWCSHLVAKNQFNYIFPHAIHLPFTLAPELLSLSVNSNRKQEESMAKI